jgi:hypothetical protein
VKIIILDTRRHNRLEASCLDQELHSASCSRLHQARTIPPKEDEEEE